MPDVELKVEGYDELQKRLDALRTDQATRILRHGLREGAKWIQQAIVERAPVREEKPSGTALPIGALKYDIEIHTVSRGVPEGGAVVIVGPGKYTAHVARWVEFGHILARGGRLFNWGKPGKGRKIGEVVKHPFERPAYEASRDVALSVFQRTVAADLDRLQTKGGK